jgi:hypothetical protein
MSKYQIPPYFGHHSSSSGTAAPADEPRVFIEPKAVMFVLGSTCAPFRPPSRRRGVLVPRGFLRLRGGRAACRMDFVDDRLRAEFVFTVRARPGPARPWPFTRPRYFRHKGGYVSYGGFVWARRALNREKTAGFRPGRFRARGQNPTQRVSADVASRSTFSARAAAL